MATTTSNFKIIFLSIFIVGALAGLLTFSGIIKIGGGGTQKITGTATIWGTIPTQSLDKFFSDYNIYNPDTNVNYVEKDPATFEREIIETIASGQAPDLILLPDNLAYRFESKMMHIPFASLPAQTFNSTYVSGAGIFGVSDGYLAIPWIADPLIMYYNQDLLATAGIAQSPKIWPEFSALIPSLTKKTSDLTITQSATALGTTKNISNIKDIMALLFMQGGNSVVTRGVDGSVSARIGALASNSEIDAAKNAINFFTAFSNPVDPSYSWNDGLPRDRDAFVRGTLAFYFGRASELPLIRAQNPNLNFNISLPPQFRNAKFPLTVGNIYGFAIPNIAKDKTLSATVAKSLTSTASTEKLISLSGSGFSFVPARRDVLANKPEGDPYMTLLYNVVLVMRTWLDPNPTATTEIFKSMINSVRSGISTAEISLLEAGSKINSIR